MTITLLGTSHIAEQSMKDIKKKIDEFSPDIIALELDKQRANSLMTEEKRKLQWRTIFIVGVKGFLFAKIGQIVQQKLGGMVGVNPGADMKQGLILAKEKDLKVALIDQPIYITLRNFSKSFTWREKWHFVADLIKGFFWPRKQIKNLGFNTFDLRTVPEQEMIEKMVGYVEKRYPTIYKTLIDDRNKYMVKKLVRLQRANLGKNILVIIGAGHKSGMNELLNKIDIL
mgnify:CR=1 FL=1|jgi:pheromone shutdown protein TraB